MNKTGLLARISCKVPVAKSSMCASRECLAEEIDLAWVAMKDT